MVLKHEFVQIFEDLCNTFGNKLDERRITRFFPRFERHDYEVIKRAFELAEEREERMPPLARLLEYVRMESSRGPKAKHTQCECYNCEGSGTVSAKKEGVSYLFRCEVCDTGPRAYPVWSDGLYRHGYTRNTIAGMWDAENATQVRGLAVLGPDSIAWSKAPENIRAKARLLIGRVSVLTGSAGAALFSRSDPAVERERVRSATRDDEDFESVKRNMVQEECPF